MALGAISSSKSAGYMGFAVTEFAAGGVPGTLSPEGPLATQNCPGIS
jgi:hypothetical protein